MAEGSRVGRYRVDAVIARGGMGIVYRATDPALERSVALKVIAPELARDEEFRARFVRESRLAAALDHPNAIPVYEAGDEDGALFIAMRFVEGRDLRELIDLEGRLDPERAIRIVSQVASALEAAHARGLVHRDVKPANVLTDRYVAAYEREDLDAMRAILAPDVRLSGPGTSRNGREEVLDEYRSTFALIEDPQYELGSRSYLEQPTSSMVQGDYEVTDSASGASPSGRLALTMERVDGQPLITRIVTSG